MNETERGLLAHLEVAPLDHGVRCIYADWLDEHDRPEEATRQRQWVEAYDFIKQFTREQSEGWQYDENDERIPDSLTFTYKDVMDEVGWWKDTVTGKDTRYDLGGSIGFSTNYAQDELQNADTRAEFWRCFTILTGVHPSDELANQEFYHCAC